MRFVIAQKSAGVIGVAAEACYHANYRQIKFGDCFHLFGLEPFVLHENLQSGVVSVVGKNWIQTCFHNL
jgi:hypothetical protein